MNRPQRVRPKNLTLGGRFFMAKHDYEFKKKIVNAHMNGKGGRKFLASKYGVKSSQDVMKWVNAFRIAGPDALRPKRKGRHSKVSKPKESKYTNIETVSDNSEYLKQLEDENLKLRIEYAYLKELRRLHLEEEALLKRQRESSTASEETSN